MVDPLAEIVSLLKPGTHLSKMVTGGGNWRVERPATGQPFYCAVLEGSSCLAVDGLAPINLEAGDFVLIPADIGFVMTRKDAGDIRDQSVEFRILETEIRHGEQAGEPNARLLVGHFVFGSNDASLLVSLLPKIVHVRGEPRLETLVRLLREESCDARPAQGLVIARLLEVLLIEALRSTASVTASPGLLRAMADPRLASAIRCIHESPDKSLTSAALAKTAALSRSAFFERFQRAMGIAPMEYLLSWRMALAKDLLSRREADLTNIAERVGYSSASTFSVAFSRVTGVTPGQYSREHGAQN